MSQIVKVSGKSRTSLGSAAARRLRRQGLIPCNVYGHKQESKAVAVEGSSLSGMVRSGSRIVDLEIDGTPEKVLVKDVQWDTYSSEVVHVDFLRVDMDEKVHLEVPLQLRGTSPGVTAGGVLEITHHVVHVECLAIQVPDFIPVRIGSLNIGGAVHVKDLQDVPEGVTILTPPEVVLVHVVEAKAAPAVEAAPASEGAEPALVNPPKEKEGAAK